MEVIHHRLALKFRLNKIENSGIHGPILLNELFFHADKNTKAKLVEGCLTIHTPDYDSAEPEKCWHIWVDVDGEVYDINKKLAVMKDSNFDNCDFEYDEDIKDLEKSEELEAQWELYKKDKKEFWKKSPQNLKNLRAKVFNNKKK
jgi:hypothetical protein